MRFNLAVALRTRYERTRADKDRAEAIELFRPIAYLEAAPTTLRLRAARLWGRLEADAGNWPTADSGLGLAVELLPRVAAHNLRRGDQEYHLKREPGLVADAVAVALRNGNVDRAAVLFEQGRGVLVAHTLDLRRLTEKDSSLAAEFTRLRDALDSAGNPALRRRWTNEWEALLPKIRSQKGFAGFLLPMTAEQIREAACEGPIVMVNVSDYRSDALVVRADGIDVVTLPLLTRKTMETAWIRFIAGLEMSLDPDLPEDRRDKAGWRIWQCLQWLWDTIAGPVLSHLGLVEPPAGGRWKRLWWLPSDVLNFLPVHAASAQGAAGDDAVSVSALDLVISSYTPTVRALQHARARNPKVDATVGPLVVAMPETPGQHDLTYIREEAEFIEKEFPGTVY